MADAAAAEVLLSDAAGLPAGPCRRCEREVLVVVAVGDATPGAPDEEERYACAHCGGPVRGVYLVDEADLDRLGYAVHDPTAASGCATGCAAGGCAARPRS